MMLIYWGKKMTVLVDVKKASWSGASLPNKSPIMQRFARLIPQYRAACGVSKAAPRRDSALGFDFVTLSVT